MFTSSCSEDWWRGRFVSIAEFFSRWRSRIFASEVFFFHLGENLFFIHSCLRSHYKPEMSINSHECRDVTENFISSLYAGKLCQGFVGLLIRYNFKRGSSPFFIASFVLWMSVAWITRSAEHCDLAFTYVIKYSFIWYGVQLLHWSWSSKQLFSSLWKLLFPHKNQFFPLTHPVSTDLLTGRLMVSLRCTRVAQKIAFPYLFPYWKQI